MYVSMHVCMMNPGEHINAKGTCVCTYKFPGSYTINIPTPHDVSSYGSHG